MGKQILNPVCLFCREVFILYSERSRLPETSRTRGKGLKTRTRPNCCGTNDGCPGREIDWKGCDALALWDTIWRPRRQFQVGYKSMQRVR